MRGRKVVGLAVLGAIYALAVFSGCGSSDSSSSAAATDEASAPLSKAEFIKQAQQICQDGVKQKEDAVTAALNEQAAQSAPTAQETAELVEQSVLPSYRKTVEQLKHLGAPTENESQAEKLLGEFEKALKAVETDPAKAAERNPFSAVDEAARTYGIEGCTL